MVFWKRNRPTLTIDVREGAKGRWRWYAYRDKELDSMSGVRGYDSRIQAVAAARKTLQSSNKVWFS